MPYVKIEEMNLDEQIDTIIKALRQLQARFDNHEHGRNGTVLLSTMVEETVDMSGKYVEDDC